jgi:hypothetical protein
MQTEMTDIMGVPQAEIEALLPALLRGIQEAQSVLAANQSH